MLKKNMMSDKNIIALQDEILEYIINHKWGDYENYGQNISKKILDSNPRNIDKLKDILEKYKTNFFEFNEIPKHIFLKYFPYETILKILSEIQYTNEELPALKLEDIFSEIKDVNYKEAEKLTNLLDIPERQIQDLLRISLREKGATNMVQRKSDTSLEIADLEDFTLKIKGKDYSFTSVVKGYRSLKKKTATLAELMHQVVKANITNPDYILLVLAKPPVDGVISYLTRYGKDIGNRNLIILVDPVELARFLRCKKVI